jgi:glucosamine--fructose-6-phosphate aminotransferase (isomerizing)
MNSTDPRYTRFGLVGDMLATVELMAKFDPYRPAELGTLVAPVGKLFFTGEGSSRIFPAKHAIRQSRRRGDKVVLHTEAGLQAREYALDGWAVLALSNSGKTSEVVRLFNELIEKRHPHRYSLTAAKDSKLESLAARGWVLGCGGERAVAATKSVIEQALFCQCVLEHLAGRPTPAETWQATAFGVGEALAAPIDAEIVRKVAAAGTIYFAGPNDGVAEELTLKTNEITRKKSDYLEGTYAVHGIEEVMDASDVVIWVDPPADSEEKFHDVLVKGVGLTVIAISSRTTRFPTIRIPECELSGYVLLAAGWNLLVEVGLALGVDLDKPVRARKVGNEFVG